MEKLDRKLENASKALEALIEADRKFKELNESDYYYISVRDSSIKSFEFTIDCFWKLLKALLFKIGIEATVGPKGIIKESEENNIISKEESKDLIRMIEDRNISSHIYEQDTADEIANNISTYVPILEKILLKIKDLND